MAEADLNAVRIFVEVVDAGSIRAAARRLGLPRSTVGRRIAELEGALAVRLFARSSRAAGLTAEGAAYLALVRGPVEALGEAGAAVGAAGARVGGTLRISVPPTFGDRFLLPIVARYLERYPGVRVAIDLSDRRVDLVAEGFDLAVRAGALDEPELVRRRIGDAEVAVVAAPAYLAARGTPARPAELAGHDCLIQGTGAPVGRWPFHERGAPVSVEVRGRIASASWAILRGAAVAGLGVARLPAFYVAEDVAAGRLVPLLAAHARPASDLFVVYPGGRGLPARTRAFLELLAEAAPGPGRAGARSARRRR